MKWLKRTKRREKRRDERLRELMLKADYLIYKKKLFLKPNFTKQDLAEALGTNRTYLGEALSTCRRCKWEEYINSFRLRFFMEEVCLTDTQHIRIDELAERCGFGCANTLNKYMKRKYGITAAVYRKNLSTSLSAEGKANTATLS